MSCHFRTRGKKKKSWTPGPTRRNRGRLKAPRTAGGSCSVIHRYVLSRFPVPIDGLNSGCRQLSRVGPGHSSRRRRPRPDRTVNFEGDFDSQPQGKFPPRLKVGQLMPGPLLSPRYVVLYLPFLGTFIQKSRQITKLLHPYYLTSVLRREFQVDFDQVVSHVPGQPHPDQVTCLGAWPSPVPRAESASRPE